MTRPSGSVWISRRELYRWQRAMERAIRRLNPAECPDALPAYSEIQTVALEIEKWVT
jgi:hypothetical protein